MFYGKEIRKLDEKGRLSLKRNQIRYLGDRPFGKKQSNRLVIYPEQLEKEFKPFQIWKMKIDNQGRLSIPAKLLNSIGAWKKIILIGGGDHFEIRPQRKISLEKITTKVAPKERGD